MATRPLAGVRVVELGQLLAGPTCGFQLAAFGADVIKVEPPHEGDPLRRWRTLVDGTSLWHRCLNRDKRCITLDLRKAAGQTLLHRLLATGIDVLIENFRPGTLERWGFGPDVLEQRYPRLVVVRISGYGQDGPYARRTGFANVAEAFGGLRHLTGEPGRPPVRTGVSLGDTLAGMQAAYAALAALHERDVRGSGRGQVIDCALYESVFSVLESLLPDYDRMGVVRGPAGATAPGIVPSNTYLCGDGKRIVLGANSDGLFRRLMATIERPDLAQRDDLRHNDGRVAHAEEIDAAIEMWTRAHPSAIALQALVAAEIPAGPINSIADIVADPHFAAREMFVPMTLPDGTSVRMPAVVPKLSRTPGGTSFVGPDLGAHNDEIYGELLRLSTQERAQLASDGVI